MRKAGVLTLAGSHVVNDMYQGAVPALIPFFVAERGYNFVAVSGLTLAAAALSSVVQPAFGIITDKRHMFWLIAAGLTLAGVGVGLSGLTDNYILTLLAIGLSGLGVAAFHPEAARSARVLSEGSGVGMSWFSLGGNIGFSLGPVFVTAVLLITGVGGTFWLAIPALAMGTYLVLMQPVLLRWSREATARRREKSGGVVEQDNWREFIKLVGVVVCRSILFFGLATFLALYVIRLYGGSKEVGQAALTLFLVTGAGGTLLGGWLADKIGRLIVLRLGYLLAIPALVGVIFSGTGWVFGFIVLLGLGVYLPFSVQVTLGQDYLPRRVGTASGITLGLAVSAGGLFSPLLGLLADATDLRWSLVALLVFPLMALTLVWRLSEPNHRKPDVTVADLPQFATIGDGVSSSKI
jgi:MFS transporter, FSR family, fosmidomycin resistance protein